MSFLAVKFDDHAVDVSFTKTSLHCILADGREISVPLEWFSVRGRDASPGLLDRFSYQGS